MKFYLYCVTSPYTARNGLRKLGCTVHPVQRLQVYQTGDPVGVELEKYYEGIWEVSASSREELVEWERHVHSHFEGVRQFYVPNFGTCWDMSILSCAHWLDVASYMGTLKGSDLVPAELK